MPKMRKEIQELGIFSKHCLRILEFLMGRNFDDEITRYDIERRLRISSSRAYEALESLRRAHLVKFKRVKESARRNAKKEKRIYELTLNGLMCTLILNPTKWKSIDKVVKKQPWLFPPIFENWPLFKQRGILPIVKESLRETFEFYQHLINIKVWWPPRHKRYLPRKPILCETEKVWLKLFHPECLQGEGKFRKLLEDGEENLTQLITEDESELKRILVHGFMRKLLRLDKGFLDVDDPEVVKVLEVFSISPKLCELLQKVLKHHFAENSGETLEATKEICEIIFS